MAKDVSTFLRWASGKEYLPALHVHYVLCLRLEPEHDDRKRMGMKV